MTANADRIDDKAVAIELGSEWFRGGPSQIYICFICVVIYVFSHSKLSESFNRIERFCSLSAPVLFGQQIDSSEHIFC